MTLPRDELLSCPFCGGESHLSNNGPGRFYVHCMECISQFEQGTPEDAVAAWNRRAALSSPPEARADKDFIPLPEKYYPWSPDGTVAELLAAANERAEFAEHVMGEAITRAEAAESRLAAHLRSQAGMVGAKS